MIINTKDLILIQATSILVREGYGGPLNDIEIAGIVEQLAGATT